MKTGHYFLLAIGLTVLVLGAFLGVAALQAILNYTHEQDAKFMAWILPSLSGVILIFGGMLSLKYGKALMK